MGFLNSHKVFNPKDELSGSLKLWLKGQMVSDGAAQFTRSNSEYLQHADTEDLRFEDGTSYMLGYWIRLDDLTNTYVMDKWGSSNANTKNEFLVRVLSNTLRCMVRDTGASSNKTVNMGAVSANTWYCIFQYYNGEHQKIGGSKDGGDFSTATIETGPSPTNRQPFRVGRGYSSSFHNGRFDSMFVAKPDLSGMSEAEADAFFEGVRDAFYNGGDGIVYDDVSDAQKSSWGMKAWYNFEEESGTRYDAHGSYDLTDNNTVTSAEGIVSGMPSVTGDSVKQVTDCSGEGNHAIQVTGSKKPTLVAAAQHGRDAFETDGSDDYFDLQNAFESEHQDDFAYVAVIKINDGQPTSVKTLFGTKDGSFNHGVVGRVRSNGQVEFRYSESGNHAEFYTNDTLSDGAQSYAIYVFWADFAGGSLRIRKNGAELSDDGVKTGVTSGVTPANYSLAAKVFASCRNNNGSDNQHSSNEFAELMLIANPTEVDIENIEAYLSGEFNIALS